MLVFKGAKIYPVVGDVIEDGRLRVNDAGRIEAIGGTPKIAEEDQLIDLAGKVIIPGLIDAHTHMGIVCCLE